MTLPRLALCPARSSIAVLVTLSLVAGTVQASMVHSFGEGANQFQMDFVRVGHVGNAADTRSGNRLGRGSVGQVFDIGTYHVTNPQYAAFLNTVATAGDPHGLYHSSMGSAVQGGIDQGGSAPNLSYEVKTHFDGKPVNFVSFYDAARFTNWLTTGDTEKGVYSTYNAGSGQWEFSATPDRSFRNSQGKAYFLPSEDEWYKAAYYRGAGTTYWESPTHATDTPATVTATATGDGSAGGTGNFANFNFLANWNGSGTAGNVTTVGTSGGPSFYGAYDMAGNVWDWIETVTDPASGQHGRRGGSFGNGPNTVVASGRYHRNPASPHGTMGIRVASVSDLLAYEGFNYSGTNLEGQDGGYGFSGAWTGSFNHLTNDGVSLNSPAFPFATSGSHISGTGGTAIRPLPGIFNFDQDGTLYLSALVQKPTEGSAKVDIAGYDGNSRLFRMSVGGGDDSRPFVGAGSVFSYYNYYMTPGDSYFFVAKIDALASGDDTISLKVYGPDDIVDSFEPDSWDAVSSAELSGVLNSLRIQFDSASISAVDEIRIGTTWRSVAVPEPTSLLLLLSLGVAAVAVRPLRRPKRA